MNAQQLAERGRHLAESLMTSTIRLFDVGDPATDPATGLVSRPETNVVRTPCRVRPAGTQSSNGDAGGAELITSGYIVSIPFGFTPAPRVAQRGVVESSPDPSLVGLSLEVHQVARGDNITARRLLCEEVA